MVRPADNAPQELVQHIVEAMHPIPIVLCGSTATAGGGS